MFLALFHLGRISELIGRKTEINYSPARILEMHCFRCLAMLFRMMSFCLFLLLRRSRCGLSFFSAPFFPGFGPGALHALAPLLSFPALLLPVFPEGVSLVLLVLLFLPLLFPDIRPIFLLRLLQWMVMGSLIDGLVLVLPILGVVDWMRFLLLLLYHPIVCPLCPSHFLGGRCVVFFAFSHPSIFSFPPWRPVFFPHVACIR